eukprot:Hpha_TRINITY_DN30716_c0_g1::TRINITY_DN30716_c0_g1_i1::g.28399::m.28399
MWTVVIAAVLVSPGLREAVERVRGMEHTRSVAEWSEAAMDIEASLPPSDADDNNPLIGQALFTLGVVRSRLEDADGALEAYTRCEDWHRRHHSSPPLSLLQNIAIAHSAVSRFFSASVAAERWASRSRETGKRIQEVEALAMLGSSLLWAGAGGNTGDRRYAEAV